MTILKKNETREVISIHSHYFYMSSAAVPRGVQQLVKAAAYRAYSSESWGGESHGGGQDDWTGKSEGQQGNSHP